MTNDEVQRAIDWLQSIKSNLGFGEKRYKEVFGKLPQHTVNGIENANLAIQALKQCQFPSAIQWTGDNLREVIDLVGLNPSARKWTWEEYEQVVKEKGLKMFTPDGAVMAEIGDWIVYNGKDCYVTALRQYQPIQYCSQDEIEKAVLQSYNDSGEGLVKHVKRRLAHEVADDLVDDGYITFETEDRPLDQSIRIKASITVKTKEDA